MTRWTAPDAEQEQLRRHYLEHLAEHPDGWSRTCSGAHLTASALICAPAEQQVLLTLHARIGRWLQTGGHLEVDDASLGAAALREAREESGLALRPGRRSRRHERLAGVAALGLDPVPLLLSRHRLSCGKQPTYHLDVQFLVVADASAPVVSAESLDVSWFDRRQLPGVDDSVHQLIAAAGRRLGWR